MEASWDDLKLFLIVAEGGGLSAASVRTGISAPTIGRRMLALERTMNRILFERSRRGYVLAADGICLLERVREMSKISGEITDWHSGAFADPFVGMAGDSWMAMFLAQNNKSLSKGPGDIRFCCFDAQDGLSMINRDSDIAILCNPPQTGNFAVAPYGLRCLCSLSVTRAWLGGGSTVGIIGQGRSPFPARTLGVRAS